jgi:hypothetical protein
MNRLRIKGLWSNEPSLEQTVAGVLTFSPRRGLRLALSGSFTEQYPGPEAYPALFGVIEHSKLGRFVKLTNCLRVKATIGIPGFATEEISPTFAFFSHQALGDGPMTVAGGSVRFGHLDEWASAGRGFNVASQPGGGFSLSYAPPSALQASTERGNVSLRFSPVWSRHRSGFRVAERAVFDLTTIEHGPAEELLASLVRPLHDFVTFALDRPTAVDDLTVSLPQHDPRQSAQPVSVIYKPIYAPDRSERRLAPSDMLFALPDVQDSVSSLLSEWFGLHAQITSFFGAFFGLLYAPPKFVEIRFFWTLHAVGLLASSQKGRLGQVVPDLSDESSLRWLVEAVGEFATAIVPDEDAESFIREVRETRNRVAHGQLINPVQLHWLTETIRWLTKTYILMQLHSVARIITGVLDRNPSLAFARQQLQQ